MDEREVTAKVRDGVQLVGAQPLGEFKKVIDKELAAK
jgi:hypothetical protein